MGKRWKSPRLCQIENPDWRTILFEWGDVKGNRTRLEFPLVECRAVNVKTREWHPSFNRLAVVPFVSPALWTETA
jgi:hypothetical protein